MIVSNTPRTSGETALRAPVNPQQNSNGAPASGSDGEGAASGGFAAAMTQAVSHAADKEPAPAVRPDVPLPPPAPGADKAPAPSRAASTAASMPAAMPASTRQPTGSGAATRGPDAATAPPNVQDFVKPSADTPVAASKVKSKSTTAASTSVTTSAVAAGPAPADIAAAAAVAGAIAAAGSGNQVKAISSVPGKTAAAAATSVNTGQAGDRTGLAAATAARAASPEAARAAAAATATTTGTGDSTTDSAGATDLAATPGTPTSSAIAAAIAAQTGTTARGPAASPDYATAARAAGADPTPPTSGQQTRATGLGAGTAPPARVDAAELRDTGKFSDGTGATGTTPDTTAAFAGTLTTASADRTTGSVTARSGTAIESLALAAAPAGKTTDAATAPPPPLLDAAASSTAANPAAPTLVRIATPVTDPGFGQAVSHQLVSLAKTGAQSAELTLNPESLGPVTVSIQMNGLEASVSISAGHEATRTALREALPHLGTLLAQNGLQLGGAQVGDGSERNGGRQAQAGERPGTPYMPGNSTTRPAATAPVGGPAASIGSRLVDTFA